MHASENCSSVVSHLWFLGRPLRRDFVTPFESTDSRGESREYFASNESDFSHGERTKQPGSVRHQSNLNFCIGVRTPSGEIVGLKRFGLDLGRAGPVCICRLLCHP